MFARVKPLKTLGSSWREEVSADSSDCYLFVSLLGKLWNISASKTQSSSWTFPPAKIDLEWTVLLSSKVL